MVRVCFVIRVSVRITDRVEVTVNVRVSKLLGSDYGMVKFRVVIRVREKLGFGFGVNNPNNLLTLTITPKLIITVNLRLLVFSRILFSGVSFHIIFVKG